MKKQARTLFDDISFECRRTKYKEIVRDFDDSIVSACKEVFEKLENLPLKSRIETINEIRKELHIHSPFKSEPVDCVLWIRSSYVVANDYNPNAVAPPEMELLEHSICEDGYTQPIVSFENSLSNYEVVDGFHRSRVGKESYFVRGKVKGYLPLTVINSDRTDRTDRIASTIRHNRARGKHQIERMTDIVIELKKRNWSDVKIGKELGMEPDEVLRLCQISGLTEVFKDVDFSKAWDSDVIEEEDYIDFVESEEEE